MLNSKNISSAITTLIHKKLLIIHTQLILDYNHDHNKEMVTCNQQHENTQKQLKPLTKIKVRSVSEINGVLKESKLQFTSTMVEIN